MRLPAPPVVLGLRADVLKIAAGEGPFAGDPVEDGSRHLVGMNAKLLHVPVTRPRSLKAVVPMWIPLQGDDRCVMCPVLEESAILLQDVRSIVRDTR